MNPSTLITLLTIGISIWAFNDRNLQLKLIYSPYAVVRKKQWYRIFTHAFIHADWMHLLFNMIALWSFGNAVYAYFTGISIYPSLHFCMLYFGGVLISSLPDLFQKKDDPGYRSLGASGGVSAVVFAAIFFNPWSLIYIFFIPCPGIVFGIIYLVYSGYMNKQGGTRINHGAHLYGSLFGLLYPLLIEPQLFRLFLDQLLHPKF